MGVFKEITKADGSGVTVFYRTNLASTFDISDLDIDTESVLYRTGEEISKMTEDKPYIVLCTEDYIYTDQYGSLISVERGTVYEMEHGTVVDAISIGGGGGGGGIPRSNLSSANSPLEQNVSIKATVNLSIHFLTTALKKTGTAKLYVNNTLKSTKTVESGEDFEFDVSKYLKLGSNYFTIRTSDDNGAEKNFDFLVNAVQLILSSGFNGDVPIQNTFDYIYRIKGAGEKTVHFVLDGVDTTVTTATSDIDLTQRFSNLSHGVHTLVVYASAELEGEEMFSNELSYSLLTYNPSSSGVIIRSNFNTTSSMEGEMLKIDYLVYDPSNLTASVSMYINNELTTSALADRTQHYWTVSNYPTGTVIFKIQCGDAYVEKEVEVEPISVDIQEATEGLELKLTTYNRSNQELEPGRSTWHYNDIYCQMNNFNWQSNGWIDNKLRLNGKANVVIPFQPFSTDLKRAGKTIELEFITHNAFSIESKLISCIDNNGVGFDVTLDSGILSSEQNSVSTQFGEGNKIRIAFVIEPTTSNRLIKTYINGVLSGLKQYESGDNFQQPNPTNIVINPDEEEIDITSIRVYNRALNSKELVNNWIYDMSDVSEKINTFNRNQIYDYYGNISYAKVKNYLPIVTVIGPMPTYKGDKKKVKVRFERNDTTQYDFEQENCTIDVQGTSSQYYPRKNWKIKLADKVQVGDDWLEEKTYCMKADFMESSHTYNIGTATFINDLYDPNYYYPTRTVENKVRDTMNGFPCALFTKESDEADMYFAGTFMFNNDKADTDTLGYTIDDQYKDTSESWEFKNNTSDHCLFRSADFTPAASPLDNFEARYPDGYEDFTALSRVFEWVVSCKNNPTKFKQEFNQYFDLHYCLIYQVMMEMAIMVDSRAKNMFLDTADGIIWYPRFYDMDTCWGLNNEGVPAWSYDVEIHDRYGSAYVWDDRGASEFWNLFEEAYAAEIKAMYHELREEKLTYDTIMHYYVDNISSEFSASEYNEDSEYKYIGPLVDDGNATYLYAAQGNRQDYFRWMVDKRLKYLDSKYEYGDYNSDYATMRWYTLDGDLTITTYQTMYIKIRFGSTDVKVRVEHNTPTLIEAPAGLEFNDTEVIIWGASQIVDFGDLTSKYAGTVDVSNCSKLQNLKLCDDGHINTNLISLSLGNNPLLRNINVTNCINLGGNLNLSGCSDLRILNAEGTKLTGFTLADGAVVEELYLPSTITSLTLVKLSNLVTLEMKSYKGVKTLVYEKTNYSLMDILSKCSGLSRMRIVFDNDYSTTWDMDMFMYYYNHLLGIDEHGGNLPHPAFVGSINLEIQDYHTLEEENEYKNIITTDYPNLLVNYINAESKFSNYIYYYTGTTKLTTVYKHVGDGLLVAEPVPVDQTVYGTTSRAYSTLPETPPENTLFMSVGIKDNVSGLLFIPETIRGFQVHGFYINTKNAYENITNIIVPTSCRMFDFDFYVEYKLIYYSQYYPIAEYNNMQASVCKIDKNSPTYQNYYRMCRLCGAGFFYLQHTGTSSSHPKPRYVGLRELIYDGKVTCMPTFTGAYLTEFPSTENVLFVDQPHVIEAWIQKPNSLLPLNFKKVKVIGVSHESYTIPGVNDTIEWGGDFKIIGEKATGSISSTTGVFSEYTQDTLDCSWQYRYTNPNLYFAAGSIDVNHFYPRGVIEDTKDLMPSEETDHNSYRYFAINNPFDATGIKKFLQYIKLPYTTQENPQYFPNLEEIYTGKNSSDVGRRYYLDCPNLKVIRPSVYGGYEMNYFNFNNTSGLLKIKRPRTIDTGDMVVGWGGYNAHNTWMERGLDCSEVDNGMYLKLSCDSAPDDEKVTSFGGLINLGEGFTRSGLRLYIYRFKNYAASGVAHSILLNIFNNLYDITQNGFTATIYIDSSVYNAASLTNEDIAIATNKGWSIRTGSYTYTYEH